MYAEGEDRYLKDLDWVNMVKSIRELRALTRIILDQQQRQLLAFERESVLPSNKVFEIEETDFIQNKVPLEYEGSAEKDNYINNVNLYLNELTKRDLTNMDIKIMEEITILK